jgi:Spy/CpxP family protein refolding chaperone
MMGGPGYGRGMMGGHGYGPGMMGGPGYGPGMMGGPGYGPGMMGGPGYGPGMMGGPGYGPGMMGGPGYGHGMMGGPGYGPGMMGGPGYGPGMVGGRGYGPGMMGGSGYGPGMMGGWDGDADDMRALPPQQRQKIGSIMREHAQEQERLLGEVAKKRADLEATMYAENPDPDAVGKAYKALADAQGQLLENRVRMRNEMRDAMGGSGGTHMMNGMHNDGSDEQ